MSEQTPCFECGRTSHHDHHVVPKSRGGMKTVRLCNDCHSKVHGIKMLTGEMIRDAMAAAKEKGVKSGRPPGPGKPTKVTWRQRAKVRRLHAKGMNKVEIARTMGLSRPTVDTILEGGSKSQRAGIEAAKARGVVFGRPKGAGKGKRLKVTPDQDAQVQRLRAEGKPIAAIARATGLSRPTVYSLLEG